MAVFYIIAGFICILINIQNVPHGLYMIFMMAFNPQAIGGGVLGTITVTVMNSMRYGVARGCFSNEAGLGSAAITAAAATTDDPVRQGYINMTGTFWDTIVVCSITGLTIASSGVLGTTDASGAAERHRPHHGSLLYPNRHHRYLYRSHRHHPLRLLHHHWLGIPR